MFHATSKMIKYSCRCYCEGWLHIINNKTEVK